MKKTKQIKIDLNELNRPTTEDFIELKTAWHDQQETIAKLQDAIKGYNVWSGKYQDTIYNQNLVVAGLQLDTERLSVEGDALRKTITRYELFTTTLIAFQLLSLMLVMLSG